jgi:Ca2+-binding RTX toxin-like protein
VTAVVDVTTGIITWTFDTIDPATGEAPLDANVGLLPVNDATGRGDGFVSYTIRAKPTAQTGDVIDAVARIVFDTEEPIDTPAIFNTIDAGKPTSHVMPLPAQTMDTTFEVSWTGQDDANGSAIAEYTILVSRDGAEPVVWLPHTTLTNALFTGELGHSYAFRSIARDNAGNEELISATPNTVISVGVANTAPTDIALSITSIAEGSVNGAVVGALSATDVDVGDTFTFSLLDNEGGRFAIVDSSLVVAGPLDFESAASHNIAVRVSDSSNHVFDKPITVQVSNVAPNLPSDANTLPNQIAEGAANDSLVGITIASSDVNGGLISYSLVNSADGRFKIDATTGAVTVANSAFINYTSASSHVIMAKATDAGGAFRTQDFVIAVVKVRNVINGTADADNLNGTGTGDSIHGRSGNDALIGLAGSDYLDGGLGADKLIGGAGNDTYVVDNRGDVITESSTAPTEIDMVQASVNWTLGTNLENLTLTGSGNINGTGNSLANTLTSNEGNNVLDGKAGVDTYLGGQGNDTYVVDQEAELSHITELADAGTDTLQVAYANASTTVTKTISLTGSLAEIENVTITGPGLFNVTGNRLANVLTGNASANWLEGGGGNDTLDGKAGNDTLVGGLGNDTYVVDAIRDVIIENANAGTETVKVALATARATYTLGANLENATVTAAAMIAVKLTGNALDNTLTGNAAANKLDGGAGADTLTGGLGNDTLDGGAGADSLVGGDGSDFYNVDDAGDRVSETNAAAAGGTDLVLTSLASYTLTAHVENGRLLATGRANLTGNTLNNFLDAGAGSNVITGGSGTDTVSYYYGNNGTGVKVSLATTTAQATGGSGTDTLIGIERLYGTNYADKLTGNAGANYLYGYAGNDTINGGSGNDTLVGGAGADTLTGGRGNDTLDGGAGADSLVGGDGSDFYNVDDAGDRVSETNAAAAGGTDLVLTSLASYTLTAHVENGRLLATGRANLTGNTLNNFLDAGAGSNVITGGSGTDTVSYYYGNNGTGVKVSLATTTAQATGGSGTDTLIGIERLYGTNYADKLTGNAGANYLYGYAGNDTINSGSGNDTIVGGTGNDTLVGGAGKDRFTGDSGRDTFDFNALSELGLTSTTRDVITDFARGHDRIDLSTLDANTARAGNQSFSAPVAGNHFSGAFTRPGELYFDRVADVLYGNTDADAAAEFAIQLTGVSTLTAGDLFL